MQELVETEAQDVKNIAVDCGEQAPREMFDEDVEAAAPALGTGDDLRCECAVAFVGELPATQCKCRGKVTTSFGHCAERVIRRNAGRGGGHLFAHLRAGCDAMTGHELTNVERFSAFQLDAIDCNTSFMTGGDVQAVARRGDDRAR